MKTQMTEITILNHNKEKLDFFSYSQNMVRCYGTPENPLFCAKDIATILGYKNLQQAIRKNVDEEDRFQLEQKWGSAGKPKNQQSNLVLINKKGLVQLVKKTRKVVPPDFLKWLREKCGLLVREHVRYVCKEAETLGPIMKVFKGMEMKTQHKVGKYMVDLYFPFYRICIECDENGHADRDADYEKKREHYIKHKLQGTFIRFNPDSKDFNIYDVINKIFTEIRESLEYRDPNNGMWADTSSDEDEDEDEE
jgi:prophage antirepressor-like protein